MKANANIEIQRFDGDTAIGAAEAMGHCNSVEMLETDIKRRKKRNSDKERNKKKKAQEQASKKAEVKANSIEVDGFEFVDLLEEDQKTKDSTGDDRKSPPEVIDLTGIAGMEAIGVDMSKMRLLPVAFSDVEDRKLGVEEEADNIVVETQ